MVSGSASTELQLQSQQSKMVSNLSDIVDKFHQINTDALLKLGCSWEPRVDSRGADYGGALFNRTSDERHKKIVQDNFLKLLEAGFLKEKTTQQYFELSNSGERSLPDRYVEGTCPNCGYDDARGDQCDECGSTYEAIELKNSTFEDESILSSR